MRERHYRVLGNTDRGGVVDETALAAPVATGRLASAGLDVFAGEPLASDSPLPGLNGEPMPHCVNPEVQS